MSTLIDNTYVKDLVRQELLSFSNKEFENWDVSLHEWMTSPYFLGRKLYPVQNVFVKIKSGIELDNKIKYVEIYDKFLEKRKYTFTEREFLKFAFEEGRSNIKYQPEDSRGKRWIDVWGRRSGKTMMAGDVQSWCSGKFLYTTNPYHKYRMTEDTKVRIVSISASQDQANQIFQPASAVVTRHPIFSHIPHKSTVRFVHFKHPYLLEKYGKDNVRIPSLQIVPMACSGTTGRGYAMMCIIFDEIGHYKVRRGQGSPESVIRAYSPSLTTFGRDGWWQVISSATPSTSTWLSNEVDKAFSSENRTYIATRFPTWWCNLGLDSSWLRAEYETSKQGFMVEYGSDFGLQGEKWLDPNYVDGLDKVYNKIPAKNTRKFYFTGIDLAYDKDILAITTVEPVGGFIKVVDYRELVANRDEFYGQPIILPQQAARVLVDIEKMYKPLRYVCDQWEIMGFLAQLPMEIIRKVKDIHFGGKLKHVLYQLLYQYIYSGQLGLNYESMMESLKGLVYDDKRGYLDITAASGERDDPADSLARAIMSFVLYCQEFPYFAKQIRAEFSGIAVINEFRDYIRDKLIDSNSDKYQVSKAEKTILARNHMDKVMSGQSHGYLVDNGLQVDSRGSRVQDHVMRKYKRYLK